MEGRGHRGPRHPGPLLWTLVNTCGSPTRPWVLSTAAVLDLVKFLLARGAKVDGRAEDGTTALHKAVEHGNVALCELLLARGADPDATSDEGHTPRSLATGPLAAVFPAVPAGAHRPTKAAAVTPPAG